MSRTGDNSAYCRLQGDSRTVTPPAANPPPANTFHRTMDITYDGAMPQIDTVMTPARTGPAATDRLARAAIGPRKPDSTTTDQDADKGPNTAVVVKARPRTRKPAMFKVLMLNDDYTPMEFVVHVLERFFQKTRDEATRIMLNVHKRGVGVCGVYTYEVAETKVTQVMDLARQNQHPLQCTIEKD